MMLYVIHYVLARDSIERYLTGIVCLCDTDPEAPHEYCGTTQRQACQVGRDLHALGDRQGAPNREAALGHWYVARAILRFC